MYRVSILNPNTYIGITERKRRLDGKLQSKCDSAASDINTNVYSNKAGVLKADLMTLMPI